MAPAKSPLRTTRNKKQVGTIDIPACAPKVKGPRKATRPRKNKTTTIIKKSKKFPARPQMRQDVMQDEASASGNPAAKGEIVRTSRSRKRAVTKARKIRAEKKHEKKKKERIMQKEDRIMAELLGGLEIGRKVEVLEDPEQLQVNVAMED
ncbi:hypothetical protein RUND412_011392 [Rhizina undulata]